MDALTEASSLGAATVDALAGGSSLGALQWMRSLGIVQRVITVCALTNGAVLQWMSPLRLVHQMIIGITYAGKLLL